MFATWPRTSLLVCASVVVGGHWFLQQKQPQPHVAAAPTTVVAPPMTQARALPRLDEWPPALDESEEETEEETEEIEEPMRGLAPIEDPAEFAMVFSVNGNAYLRLSSEQRATARGRAKLTHDKDTDEFAVVAPVATSNMPEALRAWSGREVLVEGTCRARVIGFAEVSRASGEPAGDWSEEDGYTSVPWTTESLTAANVTLAAKLDGCNGSWARAASYSPAAIVARIEAPELEQTARAALFADDDVVAQREWVESGGEGRWQDAVEVVTQTYKHPLTDDTWVFVQARRAGGCGDPGVGRMAAYRVGKAGELHRAAALDFAFGEIDQVVDLDGDGQPELLLDGGSELVDLANEEHDSISVNSYGDYGCGC